MTWKDGITVKLSKETHGRLLEIGKKNETFNDIVAKLLDRGKVPKKAARGRTKVKAT